MLGALNYDDPLAAWEIAAAEFDRSNVCDNNPGVPRQADRIPCCKTRHMEEFGSAQRTSITKNTILNIGSSIFQMPDLLHHSRARTSSSDVQTRGRHSRQ
jgi:hypothetical protein